MVGEWLRANSARTAVPERRDLVNRPACRGDIQMADLHPRGVARSDRDLESRQRDTSWAPLADDAATHPGSTWSRTTRG